MGQRYQPKPKSDPNQDQKQDQDQDQKQANLQAQLQGQEQAQGQAQLAVQSLDFKSENDNDNRNSNDNKIENTIDNKVNVDVDVKVDLDLGADGLSSPVIDLPCLSDVRGAVIMPDVVNQTLEGDGSAFNIDHVNNLVDHDASTASVTYSGSGFDMDPKSEGGDTKMDSKIDDVIGDSASGVIASADAALSQDAFNQTITLGANIQFNSITLNAAGNGWTDSHDLGVG